MGHGPKSGKFSVGLVAWSTCANELSAIRDQVFIVEQNVPAELEHDPADSRYIHAVARDESGTAIATGRLLPDGKIGRMAVLGEWRGSGVGKALLTCLVEVAQRRGDASVRLDAQIHASRFYSNNGFVAEGKQFMDAGIPHIHMRRVL